MSGSTVANTSSIPAWRSSHAPYLPQTFQVTPRIVVSTSGPHGAYGSKLTRRVRPDETVNAQRTGVVDLRG